MLSALIVFNSFGTYNMHKINQFVFGNVDIADWQDYQQNIDDIKVINSKYSGKKIVFYKSLDNKGNGMLK
ncbi:hypothetical protein AGMMS4952_13430 [Spirochaetia bacterium]|nr:hypothetical protein AGMMS4952_13430 [Spirochaetia bacterium]